MSGTKASAKKEQPASRSDTIWAALVYGLPLSAAVLYFLHLPQFEGTIVSRYLHHPIEFVEITLFCCCVAALFSKFWGCRRQRRALNAQPLPAWNGTPQTPSDAAPLLAELSNAPRWLRHSWLGRRCHGVLDFLCRRGSPAGLDDHIRFSSDNDNMALDASYSFTRFLIWATPILGFLGTVVGISESIAGVSSEKLEQGLSAITGGLATAFDTTGLALMLTLVMMFISFLVERTEQKTMQDVDEYVDVHLFHRFARPGGEQGPMVEAMETLVQQQADVWAASLTEMDHHANSIAAEQQESLTTALGQAIEQSLTAHDQQLTRMHDSMIEQTAEVLRPLESLAVSLRPLTERMHELAQTLAELQKGEKQLVRLQSLLQQNLQALSATGSFEEAVHSMTAAAHLLSARSGVKQALRLTTDERDAA